jgi:MtfA peptidase
VIFNRGRTAREQQMRADYDTKWSEVLASYIPGWARMGDDERTNIKEIAAYLAAHKNWEAAHGFAITDEVIAVVAAQAALPIMNLGTDPYRDIHTFVVVADTMVLRGEHYLGNGMYSRDDEHVIGVAERDGEVFVVWKEVHSEANDWPRGKFVVVHECAHVLDGTEGVLNGTPAIDDPQLFNDWCRVCQRVFTEFEASNQWSWLDDYAATNVVEFFGVITETFFADPVPMARDVPDLYDVLCRYYLQDPASRMA